MTGRYAPLSQIRARLDELAHCRNRGIARALLEVDKIRCDVDDRYWASDGDDEELGETVDYAEETYRKLKARHDGLLSLGRRVSVRGEAGTIEASVVRRRRRAPRRRGAGRPAGCTRVRRHGASSRTASCDPGDDGPGPQSRRRRCTPVGRRSKGAS